MANTPNIKRHQQFGLILLLIAVVVGLAFTVWYFTEKKTSSDTQKNTVPVAAERDSYNPADIIAAD